MANVSLVDRTAATGEVKTLLDRVNGAFDATPAMFAAVANSPAALKSMWGSFGAFAGGKLGPQLGELIAVAVANRNLCEYCLAAHTFLGAKAGLTAEVLAEAQLGNSDDARIDALLKFALKVVETRGQTTAADLEALRAQGWSDEEIVETIAQVALNIFTNYINITLDVPVDFPAVALR